VIPQILQNLRALDGGQVLRAVFDIAVVAYFIYRLILLSKGRRSWWIIIGLGVFFLLLLLSEALGLMTLNWILKQVTPLGPVAILVLFYPELRDVLERLGRAEFWANALPVADRADMTEAIEEVVRAVGQLSPLKIGALIVLEREADLGDVLSTGTTLDAEVSSQLLATIFHHGTPLHDGAVVIRGGRVAAAECRLPLSDSSNIAPNVHLRHRAAMGLTEVSDAVVVVVSEETGTISLSVHGKLKRGLSPDDLRKRLLEEFGRAPKPAKKQSKNALPAFFGRKAGATDAAVTAPAPAKTPATGTAKQ
jgi:diadenylate cyclase